jgi:CelD/BcsL family acetyltransferase involved in cellulose biosynthesis
LSHTVEIDQCRPEHWAAMARDFDDANLYQTWAYGESFWGAGQLSHIVVRQRGLVTGMAQLRVIRVPIIGGGMAHLRWGPLCQRRGSSLDHGSLRLMLEALRREYVERRGMHLQIFPFGVRGTEREIAFKDALNGFKSSSFGHGESYRTVLVSLTPDLSTIRRSLDQKWRNQLNRAERNELTVRECPDDSGFPEFAKLYQQMVTRKGLSVVAKTGEFQRVQRQLDADSKMPVLLCEHAGRPVAGLVTSAIGTTGVYLLGATNEEGMRLKAAYLLQWRMMEILKERGMTHYDLGGINPQTNPGVYHFKKGFGGADVEYLPPCVASAGLRSRLVETSVRRLRGALVRLRS